ncbi:MAG: SWIM zinc finger family protein [Deltaproteobacteria bacterium]|nr:SWIM zinc finger family protein [Deltaproteobacteria bacterium]
MSYGYYSYGGFAPYVSVAKRKLQAAKKIKALQKKGRSISPVQLEGRTIAKTFWGKSWCSNLEAYSDFENRLPRGRSYLRNGSVLDLQIGKGKVTALVNGSSLYTVEIVIRALEKDRWQSLIKNCSGQIDSLIELLQGRFSKAVMGVITDKQKGLFPSPQQISMDCSCPDGAVMCKHVAAALYGVGARLDEKPELFFELRHVDHLELIAAGTTGITTSGKQTDKVLKSKNLSQLFGIELDSGGVIAPGKKSISSTRIVPKNKTVRKKNGVNKKTRVSGKKKR